MAAQHWEDAFLDAMRRVGDPPADALLTQLVNRHGIERVDALMASLVRNDDLVPEDLPPAVRDYLAETARLPEWADRALIARGEAFFELNWAVIVTLLFCASLPSAYAAHKGAQVLHLTQRLTSHVHRRIFETAQFILDVMAAGGLGPTGRGIRSAQKVRLIHTSIRHFIEYDPRWRDQWNPEWGVPINQEDLAGTLMTFSLQVLVGMKRFRLPMEPGDELAYLHVWKVVGHLMGIRDELLPADLEDAYALATTIFNRQKGRSTAGLELTQALLGFMAAQTPIRWLRGFPATIIRASVDPGVADLLEVPAADWTRHLLNLEEAFWRVLARLELTDQRHSRLVAWFSQQVVQELVKIERGGNRPSFRIPPSLRAAL
jgi:hypothetical protein